MIIILLNLLYFLHTLGDDPHILVKRQLRDNDQRRLKTKFVNGVEVVVRGNSQRLYQIIPNFSSLNFYLSIYFLMFWKVEREN